MKAFRRWLTQPVVSIADALILLTATVSADALRLGWHLPWPAVIAIVWGTGMGAFVAIGFIKGFIRSIRS